MFRLPLAGTIAQTEIERTACGEETHVSINVKSERKKHRHSVPRTETNRINPKECPGTTSGALCRSFLDEIDTFQKIITSKNKAGERADEAQAWVGHNLSDTTKTTLETKRTTQYKHHLVLCKAKRWQECLASYHLQNFYSSIRTNRRRTASLAALRTRTSPTGNDITPCGFVYGFLGFGPLSVRLSTPLKGEERANCARFPRARKSCPSRAKKTLPNALLRHRHWSALEMRVLSGQIRCLAFA